MDYEYSELESYEVLSNDNIVFRVACSSEQTQNFKKCSESDDVNLVTHPKVHHR